MTREVFDHLKGEQLSWTPLPDAHVPWGVGLGDQEISEITLLGSCGDPNDKDYQSHRLAIMLPILARLGITPDQLFNPEADIWTPERGPIEGIHTARAAVNTVVVTNQTDSPAGIMEAGLVAYGSMLRKQDAIISIKLDNESPERTYIARYLAKSILKSIALRGAPFSFVEDVTAVPYMAAAALKGRAERSKLRLPTHMTYMQPHARLALKSKIYLSGSSGVKKPAWMRQVQATVQESGIPIDDSYRSRWDIAMIQEEELFHKLNSDVHLMAISQSDSYGALGELGPLALNAYLADQSFGVCIEPQTTSSETSPTNRTRILALEHIDRLRDDFPDLKLYVANDLDDLARFGIREYIKRNPTSRSMDGVPF